MIQETSLRFLPLSPPFLFSEGFLTFLVGLVLLLVYCAHYQFPPTHINNSHTNDHPLQQSADLKHQQLSKSS